MKISRSTVTRMTGFLAASAALIGSLTSAAVVHAEAFGEISKVGEFGPGPQPGPVQFTWPSGLAVDREEGDTVFVVDEPEGKQEGVGPATFRIQKFNSQLGSPTAEATVPTPEDAEGFHEVLEQIAVDEGLSRLYVLKGVKTSASEPDDRYAGYEIDAYSTKTLEPEGTSAFYTFPLPTSTEIPPKVLARPAGMAVDQATHALFLLGMDETDQTVIQQIDTSSPYATGQFDGEFNDTGQRLTNNESAASGITVGPEGSLYVTVPTLFGGEAGVAKLSITGAGESLAQPGITAVQVNSGPPPSLTGGSGGNGAVDHGPQIAVSPDGSLVYAAAFLNEEEAGNAGDYEIRGMSTAEGPGLGSQQLVLGGGSTTCSIGSSFQAIATGNNGAVYVLDEGRSFGELMPSTYGFHLIEFGPDGHGCPVPEALFKINGDEQSSTVAIKKGELVTFEALNEHLNNEEPVELEWDLSGSGDYATKITGHPAVLTTTDEYFTPGVYAIGLKIFLKDNGSYGNPPPVTRKIEVVAPPPIATFEASTLSPKSGEEVTFDAKESDDPTGSCKIGEGCHPSHTLESYEWIFGDGTHKTTTEAEPELKRSFTNSEAQARPEKVELVVTNKEGVRSAPSEQTLSIQGTGKGPGSSGGGTTTGTTTSGGGTIPPPTTTTTPGITPPKPKLTNAEKLSKALKACHKMKAKRKRANCEKQAKDKYGSSRKKHKKK